MPAAPETSNPKGTSPAASRSGGGHEDVDLQALAQELFKLLRKELLLDRERRGKR